MNDDVNRPMTSSGPKRAPDDHAGHDRQLIVGYASGDLPSEEVPAAHELVERCRRCAALVDEIGLLRTSLARDLPSPRRPRDFRLRPEDAERLRGNLLQRLLRRIGGPALAMVQPLAGAAVMIGLLLIIATAALPAFSGASGGALAPAAVSESDAGRNAASEGSGTAADDTAASPAPEASGALAPQVAGETEATDTSTKAITLEPDGPATTPDPLVVFGWLLLLLGGVVLVVRLAARRASEDPLLR